jgi:hypothetical protein
LHQSINQSLTRKKKGKKQKKKKTVTDDLMMSFTPAHICNDWSIDCHSCSNLRDSVIFFRAPLRGFSTEQRHRQFRQGSREFGSGRAGDAKGSSFVNGVSGGMNIFWGLVLFLSNLSLARTNFLTLFSNKC